MTRPYGHTTAMKEGGGQGESGVEKIHRKLWWICWWEGVSRRILLVLFWPDSFKALVWSQFLEVAYLPSVQPS